MRGKESENSCEICDPCQRQCIKKDLEFANKDSAPNDNATTSTYRTIKMKMSITVVLLTALIGLDKQIIRAEEDGSSATNDDEELGSDDELFLFFMFSLFAFCVSLCGSFLLYISYLDDRIMKLYADKGDLVEGEVIATEFTRGVTDGGIENTGNSSSQKEYFVSVEYGILLSENYPIRIRKQLRVLECDFHADSSGRGNHPCTFGCVPEEEAVASKENPRIEIIASRDSFFKSVQFDHERKLKLLVLPDHHLSALPASCVKRRLSTRYRLYSTTFVVSAFVIAIFCFRLAIGEGGDEASGYFASITGGTPKVNAFLMNVAYVLLALTPILCIHHLLHDAIQYSLERDYFETGGDVIRGGIEDSSLSSRSDFDFAYSRMGLGSQSTGMGLATQSTMT